MCSSCLCCTLVFVALHNLNKTFHFAAASPPANYSEACFAADCFSNFRLWSQFSSASCFNHADCFYSFLFFLSLWQNIRTQQTSNKTGTPEVKKRTSSVMKYYCRFCDYIKPKALIPDQNMDNLMVFYLLKGLSCCYTMI